MCASEVHRLWLHSTDARKGNGFFLFQTITGAQVRFFFFYFYNAFPHFFSTFTIRPSILSLFQRPTGHESRRFQCQSRIKVYFLIIPIFVFCIRGAELADQDLMQIASSPCLHAVEVISSNSLFSSFTAYSLWFFHPAYDGPRASRYFLFDLFSNLYPVEMAACQRDLRVFV